MICFAYERVSRDVDRIAQLAPVPGASADAAFRPCRRAAAHDATAADARDPATVAAPRGDVVRAHPAQRRAHAGGRDAGRTGAAVAATGGGLDRACPRRAGGRGWPGAAGFCLDGRLRAVAGLGAGISRGAARRPHRVDRGHQRRAAQGLRARRDRCRLHAARAGPCAGRGARAARSVAGGRAAGTGLARRAAVVGCAIVARRSGAGPAAGDLSALGHAVAVRRGAGVLPPPWRDAGDRTGGDADADDRQPGLGRARHCAGAALGHSTAAARRHLPQAAAALEANAPQGETSLLWPADAAPAVLRFSEFVRRMDGRAVGYRSSP